MAAKMGKAMPAGHTAGIFADMTLDGPEIGTLVAVVDRAKNLPNRRTMGKQDPYCAMRLGKEAKKTGTDKRGGQTPKWYVDQNRDRSTLLKPLGTKNSVLRFTTHPTTTNSSAQYSTMTKRQI
jgi:C2 domain